MAGSVVWGFRHAQRVIKISYWIAGLIFSALAAFPLFSKDAADRKSLPRQI